MCVCVCVRREGSTQESQLMNVLPDERPSTLFTQEILLVCYSLFTIVYFGHIDSSDT